MSHITDVVVITSGREDAAIEAVNTAMREHAKSPYPGEFELRPVGSGDDFGGAKATSARVYGGYFNYLPWGEFCDAIRAAPWRLPGSVLAWIDSESDEDGPTVLRPGLQAAAVSTDLGVG